MMRFSAKYIIFVLLAAVICACSSQRPATISPASADISLDRRFGLLTSAYAGWSDVYVPVNIRLQEPAAFSISGRCTMVRGREIHMSLRVLGMEVAVVYANTDSVFAVDKFHKMYVAESLDNILRGYNFTISDIQDLLIGQAFTPGGGTLTPGMASSFTLRQLPQSQSWDIVPRKSIPGIDWYFTASSGTVPTIESLTVTPRDRGQIRCEYSETHDSPAGPVAQNANIKAPLGKNDLKADIRFNFRSAKWNDGRSVKFSLPRGYSKIDIHTLAKSLKNL